MKLPINLFIMRLIKDNVVYLGVFACLVVASVAIVTIFFGQLETVHGKIAATQIEINEINKKVNLVRYSQTVARQNIDITAMNAVFGKLLPEKEDYFSIISALETISQKTQFVITSYQINLSKSSPKKLALTVAGSGSAKDFLKFLGDYQFAGGRLITVDKIDFSNAGFSEVKLNVNFYTSSNTLLSNNFNTFTEKDLNIVRKAQEKVSIVPAVPAQNQPSDSGSYDVKQNPF